MGFTSAGGLMMGTRPGDLDPGVAWYMMRSENLTPKQFNNLINHESGLLGVSETSSDMHDLLDNQMSDIRAAEAVELFCYLAKKMDWSVCRSTRRIGYISIQWWNWRECSGSPRTDL
jgi:acetate kinase